MARFYFHLIGRGPVVRSTIGEELDHLTDAIEVARIMLIRHALERVLSGMPYPEHSSVEICSENGNVLHLEWCWGLIRDPTPLRPDPRHIN